MSKEREALKLALEALEYISSHYMSLPKIGCMALAAVEEALAEQPASGLNPLWVATHPDGLTTPQPAQQEPVAFREVLRGRVCGYTPGISRVELQLPEGTLIAGWLELGETVYIAPQPAQQEPQQPAQQGWKLVPVEPTPEMIRAAEFDRTYYGSVHANSYRAMLNAAPQPAQHDLKPKFVRNVDGVPCITLVEHEHLLNRQTAQQQEPVAYRSRFASGDYRYCKTAQFFDNAEPLYTSPPASKPLTDEQRNWVVATCPTPRHIIDTVEKMHGIKGDA